MAPWLKGVEAPGMGVWPVSLLEGFGFGGRGGRILPF